MKKLILFTFVFFMTSLFAGEGPYGKTYQMSGNPQTGTTATGQLTIFEDGTWTTTLSNGRKIFGKTEYWHDPEPFFLRYKLIYQGGDVGYIRVNPSGSIGFLVLYDPGTSKKRNYRIKQIRSLSIGPSKKLE